MKEFNLYCFPYAGGSAAAFNRWRQYLDTRIEMHSVELAGRGRRIYDPLYQSMEEAVDDALNIIGSRLQETPYALFGHSMGGIIAYELTQKIRERNLPQPRTLFVSGRGAPHIPYQHDEPSLHRLPDEDFKKEIIRLGGTPKEFFDHPELMGILLPMLRSDFQIAETYEEAVQTDIHPLDIAITVLIGKKEDVTAEQVHGWKDHTRGVCTVYYLEGEHFFINEETEKIVTIINSTLLGK